MEARYSIISIGLATLIWVYLIDSATSYRTRSLRTKLFSGWLPAIWYPDNVVPNIESKMDCLIKCAINESCLGVHRDGRTCTFFSTELFETEMGGNSSQVVSFVRPDPVVLLIHGFFSLDEAKTLCASINGKLAGRADLQRMYDEGHSACQCGWIDEGYGLFPVTYVSSGCGGRTGLIECDMPSLRSAAWCKFV